MSLKNSITYIYIHTFAKAKVDSSDSLPLERILAFHNVLIHRKLVLNKDKNYYYYKIL